MNAKNEWDVVIVGGGPAGLNAALALGRARKHVLLCDAGPRRNAAAQEMHNFATRDGIAPSEFRRIGREQLAQYPSVEVRDENVEAVSGERGAFRVKLPSGEVMARRVLLTTGLIDEVMPIEGAKEVWGHSMIQCPYCHGWELKDRPWGYLAREPHLSHAVPFTLMLRGWSREVSFFTNGLELPSEVRAQLESGGVRVVTSTLKRLVSQSGKLERVELADGASIALGALFVHPPQHQVSLVQKLGLALNEEGFVRVDAMKCESSVPGIFAAGDLTTRMQGAIFAAAAGMQAAAMLNLELTMERPL
jgi:thioredoxin reductase